jgi:hypothetical protein
MSGLAPYFEIRRPLNAMARTAPIPIPSNIQPNALSSTCSRAVARGTWAAHPPNAAPLTKKAIAVGNQKR